jgi:hypothetical protein
VDIPTKFHEVWWKESNFVLNPPFFVSMATFVQPIPIFLAYLVPLDVDVVPIRTRWYVSCFTFYRYSYLLSFKFSVVSGMVVFILAFLYSFALCVCSYSALATVFCASQGNFRIL